MKRCPKCEFNKEVSFFYKSKHTKDGLTSWCRECNTKFKKRTQEQRQREREYSIRYDADHKEEKREYNKNYKKSDIGKKWFKENKDKVKNWLKKYSKTEKGIIKTRTNALKAYYRYPEKAAARLKVYRAVAKGALIKVPCTICGEKEVEGHHPDYSKPLDVIWLCTAHHVELHKNLKDHINKIKQ